MVTERKTMSEILRILSNKSGIPLTYEVVFTDLEKARKSCSPSVLRVFDEDGVEHPYMKYGMRFDNPHRNIKAVKFIHNKPRTLEDFGVEIKFIKKVKICEGGGWYSWGGLYEVDGMFFEQ